jgi:hypothetical protein
MFDIKIDNAQVEKKLSEMRERIADLGRVLINHPAVSAYGQIGH